LANGFLGFAWHHITMLLCNISTKDMHQQKFAFILELQRFSIETKRPAMPHKRAKKSVREQQRKGRLAYPTQGS
jgi:hypothetical protein